MAERNQQFVAESENAALKKLQALSGVAEKGTNERLDWMYEQSTSTKSDLEALNAPVQSNADKDMNDVKALGANTAGSLFLKGSATRTTEDMLRKLREDPLFQIRREEQAAKESMMQNPLIVARMKKKQEKVSAKDDKKAKKAAKKEKKAMKKAKKAAKKAGKHSSSSSSSADGGAAPAPARVPAMLPPKRDRSRSPKRERSKSPPKRDPNKNLDIKALGPDTNMLTRREEYAQRVAERKTQALDSRGAPKRMTEEEKKRKIEQMQSDAKQHDKIKDKRIAVAEQKQKEEDEKDSKARGTGDQKIFREMREQAYMEAGTEGNSLGDRLKNQRQSRQKNIIDSLER